MAWRKLSLAGILERIPIGVAVTRPDGRMEYANAALCALLCKSAKGLVGRRLASFRLAGSEPPAINDEVWQGELHLRSKAREHIHLLETIHPLGGEGGAPAYRIHFLQDLSAQKHVEQLSTLAFYDSLTGLPNRNLLQDRLTRAILTAERQRGGFALLFIDIDHFKAVNDSLGHDAGDRLLRAVAERLVHALRKSDTLARYGGDEFVAILEGVRTQDEAAAVLEKIFALWSEGFPLNGSRVRVTLSVGISRYPQDGCDAAALLEHADRAMYQAKAQGRNRYCLIAAPYGLMPEAT